jgi:hypothetical protein
MLKRISCAVFRDKVIDFHEGLNVVLGDESAANSIGKSSLLMIIDFVFGGNSYVEHNEDVVRELGEHDFLFEFEFHRSTIYLKRGTSEKESIYRCDSEFNVLSVMTASQYSMFLKEQYSLRDIDMSFRDIVSLYSRVWGKPNQFIKKPLQLFDKEVDKDSIVKFLKLFRQYDGIKELNEKLKGEQELNQAYKKAVKNELIPKVTKTENDQNVLQIESVENELEDITNNLMRYTVNVNEIVNRELLDLKREKDKLLRIKLGMDSRKQRLESNLSEKSPLKSKQLQQLVSFFPSVNLSKIETIESFHNRLSKILKSEFEKELRHTNGKLQLVQTEIDEIDRRITGLLGNSDNPIAVVNRIYSLTSQSRELKAKKEAFNKKLNIEGNIKAWSNELNDISAKITDEIQTTINQSLIELNNRVHTEPRMPPTFLMTKDKYSFELLQNTGTGKAFINLILFDLSVFYLTDLPILVHDSFLFKNIEVSSTENLIEIYNDNAKQSFIAIDEMHKYKSETQNILISMKCIQLDNSHLLFTKDWREKSKSLDVS